MNKEGGRPAGPACVSSTRRAAANYLRAARQVINCAREEEALRRKFDCGRGALRSIVLLEQARDSTAGAAATPHDSGRGHQVRRRRKRRLWSSSRVRSDGRRLWHVDGRQRAAVASAWPHWPQCERDAARAGDPPHP